MSESGSRVQVLNEEVRVTRWDLASGADTGPHVHEYDYVVVPLVQGRMQVDTSDGETTVHDLDIGTSYYREAGAQHTVANTGDDVLSFVEVEILGGRVS